ncbi:D-arabinitol 2-dehydrogenase [ribulose-forming] [[Candida] railenensis]|uniref:D-arabinitol 2-dehydrogenase [ribulose-forming] n=1 Tax=[Candida] railenensis TaxID=45579 RepID=A0A9P0QR27_9ASCO|nr:D-arabinitol 2-dehydrogenase [ribulose-forming] [[Candida] railenensis]
MSFSFYSKEAEIKDKVALITGGTKNLGANTASELARFGANLFLHYHSGSDKAKSEEFAAELTKKFGVKVELYQGPLNTNKELEDLFAAANKAFGGVDIAINNIGKVIKKPIVEITEEEFESMDQINNKTAFYFIKEAGKNLNKNGKIISIVTSLLAAYTPFYSIYQGSKAGVEFYTKAASKEFQDKGISVNSVAPGPMDTPFLYPQEANGDIEYYKTVALHDRLTKVEDIVPIVRFLATEGGWITGQTIFASGGFTAR